MNERSKIKVLVVDDSSFLRRTLPGILEMDSEISVVGTAENGKVAIEKAKKLKPDVITLDIIMPVMDGLTALKHIMREIPTPVLIISSTTYDGSRQTMEALSLGAVDYITKPSGPVSLDIDKIQSELIQKIKTAFSAKIKIVAGVNVTSSKFKKIISDIETGKKSISLPRRFDLKRQTDIALVAIAASTGGPAALQVLLRDFPENFPAGLVIVQHITTGFSQALADRLNSISPLKIKLCTDFEWIKPGQALLSPAGQHMRIRNVNGKIYAMPDPEPSKALHRPSADVLFSSIAKKCASKTCAVIMTGMGDDGAEGIKKIKDKGGITIAQDESSSVIFGMPKVAIEMGGIDIVAPLENLSQEIASVICRESFGNSMGKDKR